MDSCTGVLYPCSNERPVPLPPPPPPPPPPQPPALQVNLVLKLLGVPSPLADSLAALVAAQLSMLTPGTTWVYTSQQPSYAYQEPVVPAVTPVLSPSDFGTAAAPAPALAVAGNAAPTSIGSTTAAAAAAAAATAAAATLGRKLLRSGGNSTKSCFSHKDTVMPDAASCDAYCNSLAAADPTLVLTIRYYAHKGEWVGG